MKEKERRYEGKKPQNLAQLVLALFVLAPLVLSQFFFFIFVPLVDVVVFLPTSSVLVLVGGSGAATEATQVAKQVEVRQR